MHEFEPIETREELQKALSEDLVLLFKGLTGRDEPAVETLLADSKRLRVSPEQFLARMITWLLCRKGLLGAIPADLSIESFDNEPAAVLIECEISIRDSIERHRKVADCNALASKIINDLYANGLLRELPVTAVRLAT